MFPKAEAIFIVKEIDWGSFLHLLSAENGESWISSNAVRFNNSTPEGRGKRKEKILNRTLFAINLCKSVLAQICAELSRLFFCHFPGSVFGAEGILKTVDFLGINRP